MLAESTEAEVSDTALTGDADLREEELERVIRSDTFHRSSRVVALLRHICERTWAGHTDELSEQQIGIHFFRRPPGFNAAEDAIVRGSARQLRKRLEIYYQAEGAKNPARIFIPKGGYIAKFELREPQLAIEEKVLLPAETAPERSRSVPRRPGVFVLLGLLLVAVLSGFAWWWHGHRDVSKNSDGPLLLWRNLFESGRRTVIVAGDPALNLYTAYTHRDVPLRIYMEQQYQNDPAIQAVSPEGPGALSRINLATMADLKLTSELVRVPYREKLPIPDERVEVRYARDLNEADLHGANLILLGASTFDPWVSEFDKRLDFHLERGFEHYTFRVSNRAPRNGEPSVIERGNDEALTTLAFTDAPSGEEHVLLIGGSTMGSVYAAEHFLFTERMWAPVIRAANINGTLHGFEVVLRSDFVKDEVSNIRVVAFHIH